VTEVSDPSVHLVENTDRIATALERLLAKLEEPPPIAMTEEPAPWTEPLSILINNGYHVQMGINTHPTGQQSPYFRTLPFDGKPGKLYEGLFDKTIPHALKDAMKRGDIKNWTATAQQPNGD
jgi:hypothetical protein